MAAGRKIKYITLASLFAISLSIGIGYASWQFNGDNSSSLTNNVGINSWRFNDDLPIEPGQTIDIANDGTVSIDGKVMEDADVDYSGGTPSTNGGTVTMKIGVDDDGNLVVSEYSAQDIGRAWFGTDCVLTFPSAVEIDGVSYPIQGISKPVTIEADSILVDRTIQLNVPDGYKYVCDDAFQHLTSSSGWFGSSSKIAIRIPASLEYLGNNAFNYDSSSMSINSITFAGTKAQWRELIANSAAAYGNGYKFFSGLTGNKRATITCSDGTISYNRNGVEV